MPKRRPHIPREEEQRLGRLMKKGDQTAKHQLVEAHYGFVLWIASRYLGCGVPMEELRQAGALGLLKAMERYDPERPTRLLTLAFYSIRRHIIDVIREELGYVSTRGRTKKIRGKYSLERTLANEWGQVLSVSLNESVRGEEEEGPMVLGDVLPDPHAADPADIADDNEGASIATHMLRGMQTRTRSIIQMRLGTKRDKKPGMSFVEIGRHYGISAERARKIFANAMKRLRRRIEDGE